MGITGLSRPAPDRKQKFFGSFFQKRTAFFLFFSLAPILFAASAILFVRLILGFQFPIPWPDETGFLAPAFDLATTGSFFDPGMNPDRVVMWMPPGYMVVLAAIFRVFGYSFALARWMSTLFCLGSLAVVATIAFRLTDGWRRILVAWAIAAAFVSPAMLADSNLARMEMLLCLVMLLSLAASVAGRFYLAGALVGAAATIHFNAVYFAFPLLFGLGGALWRRDFPRLRASDWCAMAAATLVVAAYLAHVATNWPGFLADMHTQFASKAAFGAMDHDHPWWVVWAGVAAALPALLAPASRACMTALYGLAFLVMLTEGRELWYDYGLPLGFLLILLGVLAAARPQADASWQVAWIPLAAGLMVPASLHVTPQLRPLLPHAAMLHRDFVPQAELEKVRSFITTLHAGETVDFGWSGLEPHFFADLQRVGARWTIVRHSVNQVWPLRGADWRVRCDSSEVPKSLLQFDIGFPRVGRDTGCDIIRLKPAG